MKFLRHCLALAALLVPLLAPAQTVLFTEDFEGGTGTATGSFTRILASNNNFGGGTVAGNGPTLPGTRAAYVQCPGCLSGPYRYSYNAAYTSYLYRDVAFPASGFNSVELRFDWQGQGEGVVVAEDYLAVYLVPVGYALSPSAPPSGPGVEELAVLNLQAGWTTVRRWLPNAAALAGTTRRLVFMWRNDADTNGTQPPAAFDNVSLTASTRPVLTGTYTIDNTLPTAGRNFASLAEAVDVLNSGIYQVPVTFEVQAGQVFTEDVPALTVSGSAAGRLTFRRSGAGANPVLRPLGGLRARQAAFDLAGADYVTFDGLDVATTQVLPFYGYRVRNRTGTDGARYNVVRNARITLNRAGRPITVPATPYSIGVFQITASGDNIFGLYGGVTPTDSLGTNRFNRYENLTIDETNQGLWLLSQVTNQTSTSIENDLGNQVVNVAVGTAAPGSVRATNLRNDCYGIRTSDQRRLLVQGCTVQGLRAPEAYAGGIFCIRLTGFGRDASRISDNRISDLEGGTAFNTNGTAGDISGLFYSLDGVTVGSPRSAILVANNDIRDLRRPYTGNGRADDAILGLMTGLTGRTGSTIDVFHNTVVIDGTASPNLTSTAFYGGYGGSGTISLRNNLLVNLTGPQTGTARHRVLSNVVTPNSNFNNFYLASATNGDLVSAVQSHSTLASWQAATGQDLQSVSLDPAFAAGGFVPTNTALDDLGTPLPTVPFDVLGTRRSSVRPDLGAYEFGNIALGQQAQLPAARLQLYPNPTAGLVQLGLQHLRPQEPVAVDVVNTLGQVVLRTTAPPRQGTLAQTIDLSQLPSGIYSVRVHAQEGTVVKRLVKE